MKVLWLSRHEPLPAQLAELRRLWPGCAVSQDVKPFADAADILRRVEQGGYGEVVAVAPLSVIDHLCQRGLQPLRAEMEQVPKLTDASREVEANGRVYRFKEFRRVVRLELETKEVEGHNDNQSRNPKGKGGAHHQGNS